MFASVSPLVGEIGASFGLSSAASSLITSVPVVFLGVGALVSPWPGRRFGTERVLFAALLLLAPGIAVRVLPSVVALYGGGVLVGTAIALLNVLMPGLIKWDFPDRAASMTSVCTGAVIAGATPAAAWSVPLERLLGGGWQASLASWALSALAWQVTLFMGLQSLWSYVLIAWMPTVLTDHGMAASTARSGVRVNNLIQVAGAFALPPLAGRTRSQRPLIVLATATVAAGFAGLMAPRRTGPGCGWPFSAAAKAAL
ncbi:hypothetical protein AB0K02_25465 [Streptomyces sp. NPDC049597]|uniref:hypothetical protein n=1 Tax=Streptomyces sp. NPDC049597 TaxID=3155276 RepID=UPI00341A5980